MDFDLKPCPFCGADAEFFVNSGVRVRCKVCGAQTLTLTDHPGGGGSVERVADKWNRREESPKEQSAVVFVENGFFRCGKCRSVLCRSHKFCHECGAKIDWKEEDHASDR